MYLFFFFASPIFPAVTAREKFLFNVCWLNLTSFVYNVVQIYDPQSTLDLLCVVYVLFLIGAVKIKRLGVAEASEVFFKGAASTIERDAVFYLFFL